MTNNDITTKVEETLNSIEGLKPAEANPFLYTRIKQRINNNEQVSIYENKLYKLAVMLLVFIAINVFSYAKFARYDSNDSSINSGIHAFAKEYQLQPTTTDI